MSAPKINKVLIGEALVGEVQCYGWQVLEI